MTRIDYKQESQDLFCSIEKAKEHFESITGYIPNEFNDKKRDRCLMDARKFIIAALWKYYPSHSLAKIGDLYHKDHATVLYSIRTSDNLQKLYGGKFDVWVNQFEKFAAMHRMPDDSSENARFIYEASMSCAQI